MNIKIDYVKNNNSFKGSYTQCNLKKRRTMRLVMNAYDMYRDSFCQESAEISIFKKMFCPKTVRYFKEFQRTQPYMPVTKFPNASSIKQNLKINMDGTTDIKGVFVGSDGLVILDYDNIEDWEYIGFPKGSVSKGIKIKTDRSIDSSDDNYINIGNIRFFAHALYPNKENLEGFNKSTQKGSQAMLSYSYGARSNLINFFFQQGIIVNIKPQNIVGGQNDWDRHSMDKGFKKTLQDYFMSCWVKHPGEGFEHRNLMANLTKKSTEMNDVEYINFIKKYAEKPIQDIPSLTLQKKIMQSFVNLYAYVGGYVYDETYGIEPEPMGIFIDAEKSSIKDKNILNFVKDSLSVLPIWNEYFGCSMPKDGNLLRPYAIQNDIPCLVFNWNKM